MAKRKNKTKQEVVHDIKTVQETDRIRKMVREKMYPFLVELNDTISFTKVFLQVCAVTADSAFNALSKTMTIKDILPQIKELYKEDTAQNKMYVKFFETFQDETLSTFTSLVEAFPRQIERYYTQEVDKSPILDLPIDKILG